MRAPEPTPSAAPTSDARFDRRRFDAALGTNTLGRTLLVRASTASTNDDAWDALAAGLPDGLAVVADEQTRGRGRSGRTWAHAPGCGLALSVALHLGCDVQQAGVIPLAAGLALARALDALGARTDLKWPNDLLSRGRKLAGVLCEMRRVPRGGDAVVIGVGVNVHHRAEDFTSELRESATSLAIEGVATDVESVAGGFLTTLEPLWAEIQEGDRAAVLEAWSARASFFGSPITVRAPGGLLHGIAQRLDPNGALVLRLDSGLETPVLAGDVETGPEPAS